jgi:integrase/recombinase XerC/integrase/recombinase XerD
MKNEAIAPNGSGELPTAWCSALELLEQDLRRRGAASGTRALYGTDVEELGLWAARYDLAPEEVDYPWLRRYAAQMSERGLAPRTVARKLAGLRACFRVLVEHGLMEANPAELLASPKLPQRLPRALKPADVSALLDRIPAATPLEQRDRALFELAYACGLRAEEIVDLDVGSVDFDAEQLRVEGKGGKTRFVPVGEHALRAVTSYLERARATLDAGAGRARALSLQDRAPAVDVGRAPPAAHLGPARGRAGRRPPARAAPLLRHPSTRRRCGPARYPGIARARLDLDDPGLHSGGDRAPADRVSTQPSARLTPPRSPRWKPTSKRSSSRTCGDVQVDGLRARTRAARGRLLARSSSTSRAGCPRGCPRTSRRRTSSPTACWA